MCIMEIHAHAQTATMLQAVGHNLTTSASDLALLEMTLRARGEAEMASAAGRLQAVIAKSAEATLALYGVAVAEHPTVNGDHHHDHTDVVGSERTEQQISA